MTRKEQLAYILGLIEFSDIEERSFEIAYEFMIKNNIISQMHVGIPEQWFKEDGDIRVSEWLMGQLLSCIESGNYSVINTTINISHSFLSGNYFND